MATDKHFRDWEKFAFGFGYGTGEEHIIPFLKAFFANVDYNGCYDHNLLERELSPAVAWLLINALCRHKVEVIEYGTSPRFGWLTPHGRELKAFVDSKTADELLEIVCSDSQDDPPCYPDCCNCGPAGYEAGRKCDNPFWE